MEKGEFKLITDEYNETQLFTKMTLKYIKIIQKEIKVSNEELQELIEYFKKDEYYFLCNKLKELMK